MDFDLFSYDKYIVSFSGGKDSTALLLFLIDNKVDKSKIAFLTGRLHLITAKN